MKKVFIAAVAAMSFCGSSMIQACGSDSPDGPDNSNPVVCPTPGEDEVAGPPEGKKVHVGFKDWKGNVFNAAGLKNNNAQWCWKHSKANDDIIVFWEKGFGDDPSKAPDFKGKNKKVDIDHLLKKAQEFYDYYYKTLKFLKPGSKAEDYRMMILLDYDEEGAANGGTQDFIGTLWVAADRVQDENMNTLAHEMGHCFQLQQIADGAGKDVGWGGFFEMTSQWMLWQMNPKWTDDERYHFYYPDSKACFAALTHKSYLHGDNTYHSPYVLECWSEKHGLEIIADLYHEAEEGEDPVLTYKRHFNMGQEDFNDEMWHNCCKITAMDFDRTREFTRDLPNFWKTALVDAGDGWKRVAPDNCPENYGFNAISVNLPEAGKSVSAKFRGEPDQNGYSVVNKDYAGWRYGFVALDSDGNAIYGDMQKYIDGSASFSAPQGKSLSKLWFVVMGAPTTHVRLEQLSSDAQWPYSVKIGQ